MTPRPVARGVLWGFLLALAVFALALVMGPGPASLWALLVAILALSQAIAVNVAVSLPAARGWPPPMQRVLRGWAFFTGPAFLAGGAVLALQAGAHVDWLTAGLAAAPPGTTATVGGPRFQGENFQKNLDLVKRVEDIAREKGCTPGQLALAWVLAQGKDIVPIPGTKRRKYLEENVGALTVKLTAADLRRIDGVVPKGAAAGSRYPDRAMKAVNG